ncbi:MAG: Asp-tRNA(Asn)/Glu-tRNA(Gln) amidotransferase subunit GatA [Bdellovibrionaceae bacterium]|nr:Asp-tRNA(Asn)/Glu-tRNA(Gln) amidotransferase subunit GatA [Pseudobdellovibrionaceae bacterium]
MDLTEATLAEIRDAVRAKRVKAVEVVAHFQRRIETLDNQLNSFITVNPRAMEEATQIDAILASGRDPGPLAGVPIAVKDLLCTKNLATTAASNILRGFVPPYSATVVKRLQAAGAVILGKTNLDEFGMGSSNENSAFGVCRNPWALDHVPGGSSGGTAAAVAARLAPAGIGTDTGGSIRQPASFCGLVGIKPTYGRVSRFGIVSYASSLDQAGPMARTAQDCAILLETIAGHDDWDATASMRPVPSWSTDTIPSPKGMRIGVLQEALSEKIDQDTSTVLNTAISTLRQLGAEITEVSIPKLRHAVSIYYLLATSEASSNLARYDGVRYGYRSRKQTSDLESFYAATRSEGFGTEVKRRIMMGTYALSSGYYDAFYLKASQVRRQLRDEYMAAFAQCDVILSPVTTSPAFKIGARISDPLEMYLNDIFTTSANLAGLPAIAVPGGFAESGLPIGLQFTANHFDEHNLFRVATALEQALPLVKKVPHVI